MKTPRKRSFRIGVVGLGYVGLPLAVEFGEVLPTVGFDINQRRIAELQSGKDGTLEVSKAELKGATQLEYSADLAALKKCTFFIVTVPTPIDQYKRPDLTPLVKASETLGKVLKRGDIVVYESTVYPGCTEEVCVPVLEKFSGLKFDQDFFCGYSPERINPGDKTHRLPSIKKITSGSTPEIAEVVDALYATIITAGTHKASSIKVAEAAEGHREHPARREHRAHQRTGAHLQPPRHQHRRGAAGGRHEVELPAIPPGPGGRPLHRRGPVLPDAQGAGDWLPPGNDPGRPPPERQHAAVRGGRGHQADDAQAHPCGWLARAGARASPSRKTAPTCATRRWWTWCANWNATAPTWMWCDPWANAAEAQHEYGLKPSKAVRKGAKYDAVVLAVAHNEFKEMGAVALRKLGKKNHVLYDIKHLLPATEHGRSPVSRCLPPPRTAAARRPQPGIFMKYLVTGAAGFIGSHTQPPSAGTRRRSGGPRQPERLLRPAPERSAAGALAGAARVPVREAGPGGPRRASSACSPKSASTASSTWRAQAGVRYSAAEPAAPMWTATWWASANILEGCRHDGVQHLVYASTSSVYGANTAMPFSGPPERGPSAAASTPPPRRRTS
jgi:UDP-N-acetyl-D-galactosamine dehydrogenase